MKNIEEVTKFVHERIKEQKINTVEYANKFRKNHEFKVGNKVWLSAKNLKLEDGSGSRKLKPRFCGPFKIVKRINEVKMRLHYIHSTCNSLQIS